MYEGPSTLWTVNSCKEEGISRLVGIPRLRACVRGCRAGLESVGLHQCGGLVLRTPCGHYGNASHYAWEMTIQSDAVSWVQTTLSTLISVICVISQQWLLSATFFYSCQIIIKQSATNCYPLNNTLHTNIVICFVYLQNIY